MKTSRTMNHYGLTLEALLAEIGASKDTNDPSSDPLQSELFGTLIGYAAVADVLAERISERYDTIRASVTTSASLNGFEVCKRYSHGEISNLARMTTDLAIEVARLDELSYTMTTLITIGYGHEARALWREYINLVRPAVSE